MGVSKSSQSLGLERSCSQSEIVCAMIRWTDRRAERNNFLTVPNTWHFKTQDFSYSLWALLTMHRDVCISKFNSAIA